jgi:hypothetical protein
VDNPSRSAGEHEYREIRVTLWPTGSGAHTSVSLRRRRGADLVWDRRLGLFGLEAGASHAIHTSAGVLRAAAAALAAAADRMDDLP